MAPTDLPNAVAINLRFVKKKKQYLRSTIKPATIKQGFMPVLIQNNEVCEVRATTRHLDLTKPATSAQVPPGEPRAEG